MSLLSDLNEKIKRLSQRLGTEMKIVSSDAALAKTTADAALASSWHCHATNIITDPAQDTTEYWGAQPAGLYWFSQLGCLTDQPSQYGWVLNLTFGEGSECAQIWKTQDTGNLWHRGGNTQGWAYGWTPVSFNDSNLLTFRNGSQIWVA